LCSTVSRLPVPEGSAVHRVPDCGNIDVWMHFAVDLVHVWHFAVDGMMDAVNRIQLPHWEELCICC
jgi:hypothetical protein